MPKRKGVFFGISSPYYGPQNGTVIVSAPKKICFELEKCILHGGWNANDSEVEPEPSFLQTVAFVVAGESIKPRFAQTFRANISIDVFYFARERNKVIFRIFELVTFKEYEDLEGKIQYWWFSTLPAILNVVDNRKKIPSSIPKSPFLPVSFSWHHIHMANLLFSCTNISNHYFP